MKKQILNTLIFSFISCQLLAQANKITRQVIGSSGRSIGNSMSFTFGEALVGTTKISNGYMTQGFQQPIDDGIRTATRDIEPLLNVSIYPNPTAGTISIAIENDKGLESDIHVYNIVGQKIKSIKSNQQLVNIDLSDNVVGIYLIRVAQKGKKDFTKQVILQK